MNYPHSFLNYPFKGSLVAIHPSKLCPSCSYILQLIWGVNLNGISPMCVTRDPQPTLKDHFASIKCEEKKTQAI